MKRKFYRGLTEADIAAYKATGKIPGNPTGFIEVTESYKDAIAASTMVIWVDARYVDQTPGGTLGTIHNSYVHRGLRRRLWDFENPEDGVTLDRQLVAEMRARYARKVEEPSSSVHGSSGTVAQVHRAS